MIRKAQEHFLHNNEKHKSKAPPNKWNQALELINVTKIAGYVQSAGQKQQKGPK